MGAFWIPFVAADDAAGAALADAGRTGELTGRGMERQSDGSEIEGPRLRIVAQGSAKSFSRRSPQTGDSDQWVGPLLRLPAGVAVAHAVIRHGLILHEPGVAPWRLNKIAVADQVITKQCGVPRLDEPSGEQGNGGDVLAKKKRRDRGAQLFNPLAAQLRLRDISGIPRGLGGDRCCCHATDYLKL